MRCVAAQADDIPATYTTKDLFFNHSLLWYSRRMSFSSSSKTSSKVPSSLPPSARKAPARARHAALSVARGLAATPKDFEWIRVNIPCQAACPAGTDIPGYLEAIAQGDYARAYRINLEDNVFPAVLGRVCTRPCEPACRHGWKGLGEPVAICFSKRSAADFQQHAAPVVLDKLFPATGRKIVVVGAGAAGLAAARDLARYGHAVTVLERHTEPGGMMVQGIPPFRLPRDLVAREIDQIRALGVEIRCGVSVGEDVKLSELARTYDAVVLAAGTTRPHRPELAGVASRGVRHGLEFLRAVHAGEKISLGRRVAVIGGGFTAVDCARTAKRLGAEEVAVFYRRTADEMYITPGEVEEMAHEGIRFETQASPEAVLERAGVVAGVRFVRTEPGKPDAVGRRSFHAIPGTGFTVDVDSILLGTGQTADEGWVEATTDALVVKTGDFAAGARSLIEAIADGRKCARQVDARLMGGDRLQAVVQVEDAAGTGRTRDLDALPRQAMPVRPLAERGLAVEVETGYPEEIARTEAKRCYLCHYKFEIDNELCIYCDRCLKVKPVEGCIVKVREMIYDAEGRITGHRPATGAKDYNLLYIDQSQCIRCGACKEVCPVECIDVQKVSAKTVCASSLAGKEGS